MNPLAPETGSVPGTAPSPVAAPSGPRFALNPLENCVTVADVSSAVSPWPICLVSRTETVTRVRVTFEGLANRTLPGTIGYTSFPDWLALIGKWANPLGTGNTFNEPSGSTALFWSYPGQAPSSTASSRNILLQRPVHTFSLSYAAKLSCNSIRGCGARLPYVTLAGQTIDNTVLTTATGLENYNQGAPTPPNPLWVFNKWSPLEVTSPVVPGGISDNRIRSVNINGYEDFIGVDDIYLTIINFRPISIITGGPQTVLQGAPLVFNGGVSYDPVDAAGLPHPQSDAVTYSWNFGDGVGTATSANPTYTYLKKGEYTAILTVTDPNGMSHSSTVPVSVVNVAPAVTSDPAAAALVGTPLTLPVKFTDPGQDAPWTYTINWGDGTVKTGTVVATGSLPEADRTHTYTRRDNFSVTIEVTDANGSSGSATVPITIGNRAPTAAFASAPASGNEGGTLDYSASASTDPDGDALSYTWSVSAAGSSTVQSFTGATLSYTFPDNGQYLVNLTVSDGALSSAVSQTVSIVNVAPTATPRAPTGGVVGTPLTLSVTDPYDPSASDLQNLRYAYDCGSGYSQPSPSLTFSCTPSVAGPLTVKVRVIDPDGGSSEYSSVVTIVPANVAPIARMEISGTLIEGAALTFSGLTSSDPDGHSLTYTWTIADQLNPSVVTTLNGATVVVPFAQNGTYVVTLTVFDTGPNGGLSNAVVRVVTIGNAAPTATLSGGAGAIAGQPVTISALLADAGVNDGPWSWSVDWGAGAPTTETAASLATISASHVFTTAGTHAVTLTVTDSDGASGTATINIDVLPANRAPVAVIDLSGSLVEGSNMTLSGAGSSDPDGDELTFTWTVANQANPSVVTTYTGVTKNIPVQQDGVYLVTLTVLDNSATGPLSTAASRTVTIANAAPTVTLSPVTGVVAGQSFNLNAVFADAGIHDAPWSWSVSWGAGSPSTGSASGTGPLSIAKTYSAAGTYTVQVIVTDRDGGTGTASINIVVAPANRAPVPVIAATGSMIEGSSVTLSAAGSTDPDGDALTYTWTVAHQADPSVVTTYTGVTKNVLFEQNGTYLVTLTALDNGATGPLTAVATQSITITNARPVVTLGPLAGVVAGQPLSLSGRFTDAGLNDSPWAWSIDWGAGSSPTTGSLTSQSAPITASHVYAAAGTFAVSLTVTDADGGSATAHAEVVVTPANRAPVASIAISGSQVEGSSISLNGTGSTDPDGDALTYTWTIANTATPTVVTTLTGATQSLSFPQDGTYSVTLTVKDAGPNGGLSSVESRTINIVNAAPVVSTSNVRGVIGQPVSLPFSFTDAGIHDSPWSVTAAWGSGQVTTATASSTGSSTLTNTYTAPGIYQVAIAVVDRDGAGGGAQATITIDAPPTAVISGDYSVYQNQPADFAATGSAPFTSGGTLGYLWTAGSTTRSGTSTSFTWSVPGTYTVQLTVTEAQTGLSHTVSKSVTVLELPVIGAFIEREVTFNGNSVVNGSLQTMSNYNVTFNSGKLTGDLYMAGMPLVVDNGQPSHGGVSFGSGSLFPVGHRVTFHGNARAGRVFVRTAPVAMPTVSIRSPNGSRSVVINRVGDNPGDFATIKNLTLNSNAGWVPVPPGAYGTFTTNANSAIVLGVIGSSTPAVYDFQSLDINSSSSVLVVGPVIINVKNQLSLNGVFGTPGRPDWLTLGVQNGGLNLNSSVTFNGYVVAPNGTVTISGNSRLTGGIIARNLTLNSGTVTLLPKP